MIANDTMLYAVIIVAVLVFIGLGIMVCQLLNFEKELKKEFWDSDEHDPYSDEEDYGRKL